MFKVGERGAVDNDDNVMPVKSFYGRSIVTSGSKPGDRRIDSESKTESQKVNLNRLYDDRIEESKLLKSHNSPDFKTVGHTGSDRKPKTVEHKTRHKEKRKDSSARGHALKKPKSLNFQVPEGVGFSSHSGNTVVVDECQQQIPKQFEQENKPRRRFFKNRDAKAKARVVTYGHRRISFEGTSNSTVNLLSKTGCLSADVVNRSMKTMPVESCQSLNSARKLKKLQAESDRADDKHPAAQHDGLKYIGKTTASAQFTAAEEVLVDPATCEAPITSTSSNIASVSPSSSSAASKILQPQQLLASPGSKTQLTVIKLLRVHCVV
jgi:hypothetical protein